MSILEGPFALYLEKNRQRFNSRFAVLCGNVAPNLAYTVLRESIFPIVKHVPSNRLSKVADSLIDDAFVLLRKGLIGPQSRSQSINHLWTAVFPKLLPHLIAAPKQVVGSLTNAVFRLEQVSPLIAERWSKQLMRFAEQCEDVDSLLQLGQVLAWINGLSEYRASALAIWSQLPDTLKKSTLGTLKPQVENRWMHPSQSAKSETKLQHVGRVGGFIDLDGRFIEPPMLVVEEGQIVAFDSAHYCTLHADFFGMQLRPYKQEPVLEQHYLPAHIQVNKGTIKWGDEQLTMPSLSNPTSVVYVDQTLAITVPHSHFVFLFARAAK